jgi:SAM-dependent methyltransferase
VSSTSVIACDPSPSFTEHARAAVPDERASFVVAGADSLPKRVGGFEMVVSGLVLNFLPKPERALATMLERLRPGGTLAAYVWDYAEGMQLLTTFWEEAVAEDPAAAEFDERTRFPLCRAPALEALFKETGLERVQLSALEVPTEFATFEDYWTPFQRGTERSRDHRRRRPAVGGPEVEPATSRRQRRRDPPAPGAGARRARDGGLIVGVGAGLLCVWFWPRR